MVRTPSWDKDGVRKGTWTPQEDRMLIDYITRFGHKNWRQLPKSAGLARCGKSCRLRWMNYLRPGVKRGNYTREEEETIVELHAKFGNRWSMMASYLPGRSDNEIKNHWHTRLKKRFQHSSVTNEKAEEASKSNLHTTVELSMQDKDLVKTTDDPFNNSSSANSCQSQQAASLNDFLCTTLDRAPLCDTNLALKNYYANFLDPYIEPISADFWTELYVNDYSYFPDELLAPFVTKPECSSPVYDAHFWGLLE